MVIKYHTYMYMKCIRILRMYVLYICGYILIYMHWNYVQRFHGAGMTQSSLRNGDYIMQHSRRQIGRQKPHCVRTEKPWKYVNWSIVP